MYKTVVREGVPEAVDTMKRIALDTSVLPEERIRGAIQSHIVFY